MKKIAVLIAAAVTLVPAFAQSQSTGLPASGIPVKPRLPLVSTAHKPLVFSPGHVLTRSDKSQFLASARQAFSAQETGSSAGSMSTPSAMTSRSLPATETITIAEPTAASGFSLVAVDPHVWDPDHKGLVMNPLGAARQSYLGIYVEVAPSTIYVLTFQVNSNSASEFVIATAPAKSPVGAHTIETVKIPQGDGGFAYAFDAAGSGGVWIWVSAKTVWSFQSVQLTPMPM
ncbi:MAG TPA: hypothetical protein VJX73_04685 [Terracidiphilus sp.]|nr:hypothetical protein [Terracidiphilus sp.]